MLHIKILTIFFALQIEHILYILLNRIIVLGWMLTVLTWLLFGLFFALNK